MNSLFAQTLGEESPGFTLLRTRTDNQGIRARELIDELWVKYQPFADPNFAQEFQLHVSERFWEMYLTCTLLEKGVLPETMGRTGVPDNLVIHGRKKIWIEAIAPKPVEYPKPDSVIEDCSGQIQSIPEEQLILRLASAIREKQQKFEGYGKKKVVAPDDCCVIAVNGCQLPYCPAERKILRIMQTVFPIGDEYLTVDLASGEIFSKGCYPRFQIQKTNGSTVPVGVFLNPEYAIISAVLYSRVDMLNLTPALGSDFILIHNPKAINPLPDLGSRLGKEISAQLGENSLELLGIDEIPGHEER